MDRAHGRGFKEWLTKCQKAFPELGIEGGTCHDYEINYKYHWKCDGGGWLACGHVVKRHSKSIDVETQRCPKCGGRLKQVLPVPRGGNGSAGGDAVAGTPARGPSEYQLFVKKRLGEVRRENPGIPQTEVMRIVAQEWRKKKERGAGSSRRGSGSEGVEIVRVEEVGNVEKTHSSQVEVVVISDSDHDYDDEEAFQSMMDDLRL